MAVGAASGSLVVSLALNAAEFVTGLTKSEYEAKKWARNMEKVGKEAGQLLGVGFAAGATALFFLTKNAIDAADRLNDLSKKTGVAVETLGGLGFAAKQSGTDLDGVAKAFAKLNLHIAEGAGGNQEVLKAFDAVGVSAKELKTLAPDQILAKIATAFASYADGPEKAAIGNKLFGKSYQDIIPLLDEGGAKLQENIEYYKKYGGVTAEVAQQADDFNDVLTKIGLLSGAFGRQLAAELLPSLQGLADEFLRAKENTGEFKSAASDVAEVLKTLAVGAIYAGTEVVVLGKAIGAATAQMVALATDGVTAFKALGAEADKDIESVLAKRDRLIAAIRNPVAATGGGAAGAGAPRLRAPSLGSSDATELAKKLLDQQLKQLENAIRREKELLADRQHYLDAYYQDNLITTEAYYAQKAAAEDRALRVTLDAYDKEIAAARAFAAKAKPADKIDAENKIADAIAKRQSAEEEGARKSFDLARKRQKDIDQYNDSVAELSAQVLLLSGREAEAAGIRFDLQNEERKARFKAQQNTEALAQLELLKQQTIAQEQLNKAASDYQKIQQALGIEQGYVQLFQQTGAITELDALNKRADLARKYIPVLEQQLAVQQALADTLAPGDRRNAALINIEQLRLGIQQLNAETELLQTKFRDIFTGATADFITSLVDGTKSLKDSFKDLEKQIVGSITKIASQNISESLFGKTGILGGVPKAFGDLFGGKPENAVGSLLGGAGKDAGLAALTTASTTATTALAPFSVATDAAAVALVPFTAANEAATVAMVPFTAAIEAATVALASMSTSSAASSLGNLSSLFSSSPSTPLISGIPFDPVAGYASGGFPSVGRLSLVGERGPELFVPRSQGSIVPNRLLRSGRGGKSFNMTVNVLPGASAESADQAAASFGLAVRKASARNL